MSNILDFIKDVLNLFVKKFPAFVAGLFNKIPKELRGQISVIIQVVENVKNFTESPAADFLTSIIPGTADDKLKDWLRKVLPGALNSLNLIRNYYDVTVSSNLSEDKDIKSIELHSLATLLTKQLTGVKTGQAAITAEVVYQDYKKSLTV